MSGSAAQRRDDRNGGAGKEQPDNESFVVVLVEAFEDAVAESGRQDEDRE